MGSAATPRGRAPAERDQPFPFAGSDEARRPPACAATRLRVRRAYAGFCRAAGGSTAGVVQRDGVRGLGEHQPALRQQAEDGEQRRGGQQHRRQEGATQQQRQHGQH